MHRHKELIVCFGSFLKNPIQVSDDGELQPLFNRLYDIWTTTNSPLGRTFSKWRDAVRLSVMAKDREATERVVAKLKTIMNQGIAWGFKMWCKVGPNSPLFSSPDLAHTTQSLPVLLSFSLPLSPHPPLSFTRPLVKVSFQTLRLSISRSYTHFKIPPPPPPVLHSKPRPQLVVMKRKKNGFMAKRFLVNLQSSLEATFGAWKFLKTKGSRVQKLKSLLINRFVKIGLYHWHIWASFHKAKQHRKRIVAAKQVRKDTSVFFSAWRMRCQKLKVLVTRHRMHQSKINFRIKRLFVNAWSVWAQRKIYCRSAVERSKRFRYRRPLEAWHMHAHDFTLRVKKSLSILARIRSREKETCFETMLGYAERHLVRKFRVEKIRFSLGVRKMLQVMAAWYKYVLGAFAKKKRPDADVDDMMAYDMEIKIRRCWRNWTRKTILSKTKAKISKNWKLICGIVSKRGALGNWIFHHDNCAEASSKLQRVVASAKVQGATVPDVFMAWVKLELKLRLTRFREGIITSKHNIHLVGTAWRTWRQDAVGHSMEKHEEVLVRVMQSRLKRGEINIARERFKGWKSWWRQRMLRRTRAKQVEVRRILKLVAKSMVEWRERVWRRRGIWAVSAYGKRRMARHWLRLFHETVVEGKKRVKYGTFCPDCRKPYTMAMPKWVPPDTNKESPPKKAKDSSGIEGVAIKQSKPATGHSVPHQPPHKKMKAPPAPAPAPAPAIQRDGSARPTPFNFRVWHDQWMSNDGVERKQKHASPRAKMSESEWLEGVKKMQSKVKVLTHAEAQQTGSLPFVPSRANRPSTAMPLSNTFAAPRTQPYGSRHPDNDEGDFSALLAKPVPPPQRPVVCTLPLHHRHHHSFDFEAVSDVIQRRHHVSII
jgi:hypothetical protein